MTMTKITTFAQLGHWRKLNWRLADRQFSLVVQFDGGGNDCSGSSSANSSKRPPLSSLSSNNAVAPIRSMHLRVGRLGCGRPNYGRPAGGGGRLLLVRLLYHRKSVHWPSVARRLATARILPLSGKRKRLRDFAKVNIAPLEHWQRMVSSQWCFLERER